jgi:hypothetical protein
MCLISERKLSHRAALSADRGGGYFLLTKPLAYWALHRREIGHPQWTKLLYKDLTFRTTVNVEWHPACPLRVRPKRLHIRVYVKSRNLACFGCDDQRSTIWRPLQHADTTVDNDLIERIVGRNRLPEHHPALVIRRSQTFHTRLKRQRIDNLFVCF